METRPNIEDIKEMEKYLASTDREAEERYRKFKEVDPYPKIFPSLLNSADIYKYVKETGMIFPFGYMMDDERVGAKGATYPIRIGNRCIYWNDRNEQIKVDLNREPYCFTLEKNSIVFVELEPMFRVPDYIALRFNLKIKHVYKGLLLGTGPVVDPGFCGKLFIPLHNMTNNTYILKKGEELIEMEFTKLSNHIRWHNADDSHKEDNKLAKDGHYFSFPHSKPREFEEYLLNALEKFLEKPSLGRDNETVLTVKNSIPVEIQEQREKLDEFDERIEKNSEEVQKGMKTFKTIRNIGIMAIFISVITIVIGIVTIQVTESSRHDDLVEKIEALRAQHEYSLERIQIMENRNSDLKEELEKSQGEIEELQKVLKKR